VYSEKKDGIRLSIRSTKQYDAGLIANKALLGIGNGGGHELMAGGFVPLHQGVDTNTLISNLEKRFVDTVYSLYKI